MSRVLKIKSDIYLRVVENKAKFFAVTLLATIIALGFLFFRGLNYGIDFKGGLNVEIQTMDGDADIAALRSKLNDAGIVGASLQEFGSKNNVLIKMEAMQNDTDGSLVLQKLKDALGPNVKYRNIESVGPKVGKQLQHESAIAVFFALLAILLYIWIRMDWQFGLCGVIALIHDCIIVLGFFAIFHSFEFNIASVCAILMTAGYSINDTVVIFDRMNENIRYQKFKDLTDLINRSISETLTRTILTSGTTIMALLCLCIFGGDVISSYATPMLIGIVTGTFSSIFIASPLLTLIGINLNNKNQEAVSAK